MEDAASQAEVEEVNFEELLESNEGFRNLSANGIPEKRGIFDKLYARQV